MLFNSGSTKTKPSYQLRAYQEKAVKDDKKDFSKNYELSKKNAKGMKDFIDKSGGEAEIIEIPDSGHPETTSKTLIPFFLELFGDEFKY